MLQDIYCIISVIPNRLPTNIIGFYSLEYEECQILYCIHYFIDHLMSF